MVGLCESNKISRTAQEIRSIIIISIFKQTYFTMSASSTSIASFSRAKRTCHAKKFLQSKLLAKKRNNGNKEEGNEIREIQMSNFKIPTTIES